ncbi:hypothetical protein AVEN_8655-1 [Araneus ventricosus]|uniref:Uncharacterized protein n=1 Tax=Araneus ventricosus TaxID=182803 RepID=A0A4Y2C3U2_ARAVE|nr:hypothetical protein AVEN_8655-1 [Araneus ventricosus]
MESARDQLHPRKCYHHYCGPGILPWADIIMGSRTDLPAKRGTMTGHIYRDYSATHVHLFRGATSPNFIFMDDNAHPHHEVVVDECLSKDDNIRLEWKFGDM